MKIPNNPIRNQTRGLPDFSAVLLCIEIYLNKAICSTITKFPEVIISRTTFHKNRGDWHRKMVNPSQASSTEVWCRYYLYISQRT